MRTLTMTAATIALTLAGQSLAADQTIRGKVLTVKDPSPGFAPSKRRIVGVAKEVASPNTIIGDPVANGAVLTVIANGSTPTSQTYTLNQGISSTGKPFWSALGTSGFRYSDGKGDQSAVNRIIMKRSASGVFVLKVVIKGSNGPINVLPPNPGTDGFVTLQLNGGGDRYCVQYGADGLVLNKLNKLFRVRKPAAEGCPGVVVTTTTITTTTTTSTTTTTLYGSPSRAFLRAFGDLLD